MSAFKLVALYVLITIVVWCVYALVWRGRVRPPVALGSCLLALQLLMSGVFLALIFTRVYS